MNPSKKHTLCVNSRFDSCENLVTRRGSVYCDECRSMKKSARIDRTVNNIEELQSQNILLLKNNENNKELIEKLTRKITTLQSEKGLSSFDKQEMERTIDNLVAENSRLKICTEKYGQQLEKDNMRLTKIIMGLQKDISELSVEMLEKNIAIKNNERFLETETDNCKKLSEHNIFLQNYIETTSKQHKETIELLMNNIDNQKQLISELSSKILLLEEKLRHLKKVVVKASEEKVKRSSITKIRCKKV